MWYVDVSPRIYLFGLVGGMHRGSGDRSPFQPFFAGPPTNGPPLRPWCAKCNRPCVWRRGSIAVREYDVANIRSSVQSHNYIIYTSKQDRTAAITCTRDQFLWIYRYLNLTQSYNVPQCFSRRRASQGYSCNYTIKQSWIKYEYLSRVSYIHTSGRVHITMYFRYNYTALSTCHIYVRA